MRMNGGRTAIFQHNCHHSSQETSVCWHDPSSLSRRTTCFRMASSYAACSAFRRMRRAGFEVPSCSAAIASRSCSRSKAGSSTWAWASRFKALSFLFRATSLARCAFLRGNDELYYVIVQIKMTADYSRELKFGALPLLATHAFMNRTSHPAKPWQPALRTERHRWDSTPALWAF